MKYIDLFCGVGGFRYGIQKVGVKSKNSSNSKSRTSQHKKRSFCVYSNEWDKYASSVYKKHYGECDTRDIRTVKASEIPDHDLLCAGFPCQSFSVAGKRGGFNDTRGTMFFEIARIAKYKRPRYLLLENVKGLLSHDKGKTFQTILGVLADLGYQCEWQVLNSKHFGVPQNRERVFIVGHLGGRSGRQVFPIRESSKGNLKYSGGVISAREQWLKDGKYKSRNFSQGQRIYSDKGISQTLASNAGGQGGKTGLYATPRIRRLTPIECERLQGFSEIENNVIIEVWQNESDVSVATLNGIKAKPVGSVGKYKSNQVVKSATKILWQKDQKNNKHVRPDVLINLEENGVEILSQGKLLLNAKHAQKKNWSPQLMKLEDFAQISVGINIILEKITHIGGVESHQSEECLIHQKTGKRLVRLFGKEIMQFAEDVKKDSTILKKLLKSIISDPSDIKSLEQRLIILSSFVILVISGYIPEEIKRKDTYTIEINQKHGWTKYGHEGQLISDTQRYKMMGNAVTTNVVTAIGKTML